MAARIFQALAGGMSRASVCRGSTPSVVHDMRSEREADRRISFKPDIAGQRIRMTMKKDGPRIPAKKEPYLLNI